MKCQKHPEYKAERYPSTKCEWCLYIWKFKEGAHRMMAEVDRKYMEALKKHEKQVDYLKTFKHRPNWQLSMAAQMEDVINCPRCLMFDQEQPLCRLGDYPEELMCPSCWIGIKIDIRYDGRDDV
jgi:hypothetical protein